MATFKKWISNFEMEERRVQLEILSSAVKVYLKYPDEFETLISDLLTVATENVSNPDVRDRAFIYWRMLSTDPEKTKTVVFGYRPQAKDNDKLVDQSFLSEIMKSMGYVSSLFEKKPEELFQKSLAEQKVGSFLFRASRSKKKRKSLPSQRLSLLPRPRPQLKKLSHHPRVSQSLRRRWRRSRNLT
jgi:vesicle coat complex subunit